MHVSFEILPAEASKRTHRLVNWPKLKILSAKEKYQSGTDRNENHKDCSPDLSDLL
jgi:hypothetical protein